MLGLVKILIFLVYRRCWCLVEKFLVEILKQKLIWSRFVSELITSSYFGKMYSTLGSVVPLAMFLNKALTQSSGQNEPWEYRIEYRSKVEISNLFTVLSIGNTEKLWFFLPFSPKKPHFKAENTCFEVYEPQTSSLTYLGTICQKNA